ncbi:MAG: hypothetical protein IT356_02395 [Gemmatimonadaceae bacterium]|nr:hypothetical protein [Gemmatimonadaceae bacterium]
MCTRSGVRLVAAVTLLAIPFVAAHGQDVDARWQAWVGCWTPVAAAPGTATARSAAVCVAPAQGTSAVDIISVSGSSVAGRVHMDADGQPHEVARDGCSGMETARWSVSGTRVYVSGKLLCTGGIERRASGVMSFDQRHEWLDVRSISSGEAQGVAVTRYQPLADSTGLPAELLPVFRLRGPQANMATLAASAPLTLRDIADVSASTDSSVAGAWLVERTHGVQLNLSGRQLATLADEGVPPSVIDVLVAIAYPQNFALAGSEGQDVVDRPSATQRRSADMYSYGSAPVYWYDPYFGPWSYYYDPFYTGYRYGLGSYYGYGAYSPYFGYGVYSPYYGYYYPGRPIVVVNNPPGGTVGQDAHGRVVKGRGYTSGTGSSGGSSSAGGSSSKQSGGSSSPGSSGSSVSGSSSGSGSAPRTAVRKPPPPR